MVPIEPEQGVAQRIIRHFAPAVIENQRIPISVAALARVGVLVERRAVKVSQPMRIVGEMAGDPVDDDADALAWQRSMNSRKSSGEPKRLVGANSPIG